MANIWDFIEFICVCFFQEEQDLPYEEEIIRSPYSVKFWMRYIEHKAKKGSNTALNLLYERALKELPGRYMHSMCTSWKEEKKWLCHRNLVFENLWSAGKNRKNNWEDEKVSLGQKSVSALMTPY